MCQDESFHDLVARVRAGEEAAAVEIVERYEPELRRAVHARLLGSPLRHLLETVDVCQSVFASFFKGAGAGHFELDSPAQLMKLLDIIARNKLVDQVKKAQAARRDYRRCQGNGSEVNEFADPGPGPEQEAAIRELLQQVRGRLSEEERWLLDQRAQERSWPEIAAEVGGNPDALRIRFSRTVGRIRRELAFD